MLTVSPTMRISIDEVKQHKWLSDDIPGSWTELPSRRKKSSTIELVTCTCANLEGVGGDCATHRDPFVMPQICKVAMVVGQEGHDSELQIPQSLPVLLPVHAGRE